MLLFCGFVMNIFIILWFRIIEFLVYPECVHIRHSFVPLTSCQSKYNKVLCLVIALAIRGCGYIAAFKRSIKISI